MSAKCQDQTWRLVARSFTGAGEPTGNQLPSKLSKRTTRMLQLRLVGDLEAARALCIVMTTNELSELIHAAFPVEPMPKRFWIDGIQPLVGDIPEELAKRIAHRPWVDVTMLDWTMIGHPASIRGYIDPNAFRYYLPSPLVGGLNDFGYIDWPLECLLPAGRKRRTTGKWWQEFWTAFSEEQKDAVPGLLDWRSIDASRVDPSQRITLYRRGSSDLGFLTRSISVQMGRDRVSEE